MTAPHAKPRLYYDCPLKAAWMAKYFGLEFEHVAMPDWKGDTALFVKWFFDFQAGDYWCEANLMDRYFIRPESLHLLEAQEGDEGIDSFGLQVVFENGGWVRRHPVASADEAAEGPVTIDKRNGKAFMWPEQEAA
jgi:hypothetical protein